VWAPVQARADGYLSPWAGVNFGSNVDNGRTALGMNAGFMGGGVVGLEAAFGYSPSFFGTENDFGHNTVIDLMGNVVIGIPIGGTRGAGLRPYISGGAGLVRTQIDGNTLFNHVSSRNNDLGWDLGAGLTGYITQHFGLRADIRYFDDTQISDFHYYRLSGGIVLR
jgi:opacity protein-like surface antigen